MMDKGENFWTVERITEWHKKNERIVKLEAELEQADLDHSLQEQVRELEAENEMLREAIADLYKQRMGKISTIKLGTGLLAYKIYDASLTGEDGS